MSESLTFRRLLSEHQRKLVLLACCPSAPPGEIAAAALALVRCWRKEFSSGHELLAKLDGQPGSKESPIQSDFGKVRLPFGRYKNKAICEVPESYLVWFGRTCLTASPFVRRAVFLHLRDRRDTA